MNYSILIYGIKVPLWTLFSLSLLVPLIITYIAIPTIVKVSSLKRLFDFPNERASHKTTIPNLGGLAIFASFIISAVIFTLPSDASEIKFLIGAIVVIFFAGLKDDILVIDPVKKLLSQIIAASIVVILGDIRIINFHSVMGIDSITYLPSLVFSFFLILTLINGFNLIDGVDGLSSGIGIVASVFFGICFFLNGFYTYSVMCIALTGSLIAYFIFNVFGTKNKIFMGDTGSLIIGLIISVFTIKFLELKANPSARLFNEVAPAMAFGLLIVPLFDTLRIIILRLWNGKSPFKADRNHIHHNLLKLGFSHFMVTCLNIIITLLFIFIVFTLHKLGSELLIAILIGIASILTVFLDILLKRN